MDSSRPSESSGGRSAVRILVILVVFMLATYGFFFAVIWLHPHDCRGNPVDYIGYRVEIDADTQYEVYLPVPVDSPNQTWYLVDFLYLKEGNATWSVVMTQHGLALKIIGRGSAILYAATNTCNYSYSGFSPANKTGIGPGHIYGEYFVYADAGGEEELAKVYVGAGTCTDDGYGRTTVIQSLIGELRSGWQEVLGHTSIGVC